MFHQLNLFRSYPTQLKQFEQTFYGEWDYEFDYNEWGDKFYTCYDPIEEIIKAKKINDDDEDVYWTCKWRGIKRNEALPSMEYPDLEWSDELAVSASWYIEENSGCNTYLNNLIDDGEENHYLD